MVIATQNPVEHHGTYPLPESQLDRFLMRLRIGYPDAASEREIVRQSGGALRRSRSARPDRPRICCACRTPAQGVPVDDALVDYMLAIVEQTRTTNRWRWASARAARRRCTAPRRRWRCSKAATTPSRTTSSGWPCRSSRIAW